MNLAQALSRDVPHASRLRGAAYFSGGAVTAFQPAPYRVAASVQGEERYDVVLEAAGTTIVGSCSCPYFVQQAEACKHIWAVILMCDARHVALLPSGAPLKDVGFEAGSPAPAAPTAPPTARGPAAPALAAAPRTAATVPATRTAAPAWKQALDSIRARTERDPAAQPLPGQLLYIVDLAASQNSRSLVLHVMTQDRKKNGDWSGPKPARLLVSAIRRLPADDRAILDRLVGARSTYGWAWGQGAQEIPSPFHLRGALAIDLFPRMCETTRCRLAATQNASMRPQDTVLTPLSWDPGSPWHSHVAIRRDDAAGGYAVEGELRRGDERLPLSRVVLLLEDGLLLTWTGGALFDAQQALGWMQELRLRARLTVPYGEQEQLRRTLLVAPPPTADLPAELEVQIRHVTPSPRLSLRPLAFTPQSIEAALTFVYDGTPVDASVRDELVPTATAGVVVARNRAAEDAARQRLVELGFRSMWTGDERDTYVLGPGAIGRIVPQLLGEDWQVEMTGQHYQLPEADLELRVSSGIDWFDLQGHANFGQQRVALPALLAAIERGEDSITLADGSIGLIPAEWQRQHAPLALGVVRGDSVRFGGTQLALLDALLAERPQVSWDETFAAARRRLRASAEIAPLDPPPSFAGTLRGYQREGLGWLVSLTELGFGGCLADDMGLGKTVMVLALLDRRRQLRVEAGLAPQPSLVVAPRSVIFNWSQEAARFAPQLRVLDYSTASRTSRDDAISDSDLVLTTYGTLRRDAPRLSGREFDCLVLDEAQTIKNAATITAKSARLLTARHRLALSGTPIENRLADLWSLFEFLNPGLLSNATRFMKSFTGKEVDEERLQLLGRGLRPFILRRTKGQVARDLPDKVEQTIVCELEPEQRALYDELRDHYRGRLLQRGARWERSKLQVLEALLRLRQAACHPGLVDAARTGSDSAKLDLLVPRLAEALDEGHKTLVFSQFTSFLALLRPMLDARGMTYEYLDGKTRDREERVHRFQTDPDCRLFLISLKAGGLGLNLTAADYVFLLDPWWNPAIEAQAIDRTHRIGQTRHVFAYRLIARDTVEERVLELQQRKKQMADAILTEDNSVVKNLTREDLEMLLS